MSRSSLALAAAVAAAALLAADSVGGVPASPAPPGSQVALGPADVEAAYARAAAAAAVPQFASVDVDALDEWRDALALLDHVPRPPQAARDLR